MAILCEPTPALDKEAWDILMSLSGRKLSPERVKAMLALKARKERDGKINR